jgi:hypothetical protein
LTTARAVSVESLRGATFFQHRARLQKAFWLPIPKKVYAKIIHVVYDLSTIRVDTG